MKVILPVLILIVISFSSLANERVLLPDNYRDTFVEYLSLDRTMNPDQFIRLFANDIAMQGKNEKGELPNGSVLVAEVYSVEKLADGTVKRSALGRRIKKDLKLLAVMEKQQEFGNNPASAIHTGNWDFGAYQPNGELAPKNLDACRACHTPLTKSDFLFSSEHLPNEKRVP